LKKNPRFTKQWHSRFLNRHPKIRSTYCTTLENARAKATNWENLNTYLDLVAETIAKWKITVCDIWNMDEKDFLIGIIQKSVKVIISASEKNVYLRNDGNRELVTVVKAIGVSGTTVPPMAIIIICLVGIKDLY
jgi:hypothetical protein